MITLYTNFTTKQVKAGNLLIGGGAPVSIQSMLNVRADNVEGNVEQAKKLEAAGAITLADNADELINMLI